MALSDNKIGTWINPVINEADTPKRTATEMKTIFDSNSNQIKEAFNALIDALTSSGGADIGMPALDEDIPAGTLPEQLAAILTETKEKLESENIKGIRLDELGGIEITTDGVTWQPAGATGDPITDVGALPALDELEGSDGFFVYDTSGKQPRRAIWNLVKAAMREYLNKAIDPAKHAATHGAGGSDPIVPADIGGQPADLLFRDVQVSADAWEPYEGSTGYPYRALVLLPNVAADNLADVAFSLVDVESGLFASVCDTIPCGLYLYAAEAPEGDITDHQHTPVERGRGWVYNPVERSRRSGR